MKVKLVIIAFLIGIVMTACSTNDVEEKVVAPVAEVETVVELVEEEEEEEEETFIELEEAEVKDILRNNIQSINEAFSRLGRENGWHSDNPADFNVIRPFVGSYGTEKFIENELRQLAETRYCECDVYINPDIVYEVKFSFKQKIIRLL